MATYLEPLPNEAPVVEAETLRITPVWYRYLSVALIGRVQASAYVAKSLTLVNQAAAIGATALVAQGSFGVYRVSWNVRITQAAGVSSAVTVTVANTDSGVNVAQVGPALTGNTPTSVQSGSFLVRADAATAITYAVAYTSVGAPAMTYTISVVIETVNT